MSPAEELRYKNMEDFGYGPNVMKKNKVCTVCGRMVDVKVRTCPECGEGLSDETLFDRHKRQHQCCPECDTVLAPDSQYCPTCGTKVLNGKGGDRVL